KTRGPVIDTPGRLVDTFGRAIHKSGRTNHACGVGVSAIAYASAGFGSGAERQRRARLRRAEPRGRLTPRARRIVRSRERYDSTEVERDRMSHGTQDLVERRERGVIRHAGSIYGASVEGVPLSVYLPGSGIAEILILASIHGDEAETTVVVSEALRCLPRGELRAAVILCGNPDGLLRGTRQRQGRRPEPELPGVELESRAGLLQEPGRTTRATS